MNRSIHEIPCQAANWLRAWQEDGDRLSCIIRFFNHRDGWCIERSPDHKEAKQIVVLRDARRYELTVVSEDDVWVARLQEWVPGRLWPTQHVLRAFDSRQAAIDALIRKWRILFPDEPPLEWREVTIQQAPQLPRRRRRSTPRDA